MNSTIVPLSRNSFLKTVDSRIGTVGVLLEPKQPSLFRVNSYRTDDWGVHISLTHVPMPGIQSPSKETFEIGSSWDVLSTDAQRWQARYCWKLLFGEIEIQSIMAAGAEAAARGELLTENQIFFIFKWHQTLEDRKRKKLGRTETADLMEILATPPLRPVPPAGGIPPA